MFFGLLSGTIPFKNYKSPIHLMRVLGLRGVASIMVQKMFGRRSAPPQSPDCNTDIL